MTKKGLQSKSGRIQGNRHDRSFMQYAPQPKPSTRHAHCNHHHEMTDQHVIVNIGGEEFVANRAAVPLLTALADVGLKTRSHHITDNESACFVSIMLDNADVEIRKVLESDATRSAYNGRFELLLRWVRAAAEKVERGEG